MKTQIIKIGGCLLIAAAALFSSLTASADTVYVSYPSNNTIEKFDLQPEPIWAYSPTPA